MRREISRLLLCGLVALLPVYFTRATTGAVSNEGSAGAEEVPLGRNALLKTTRNSDFRVPMAYDPQESGLLLPDPEIEYDLTSSEGRELRVGHMIVNEKTFVVALRSLAEVSPELGKALGASATEPMLFIRWPQSLMTVNRLEVISRSGQVLWQQEIGSDALQKWNQQLSGWREVLGTRGVPPQRLKGGLFSTHLGLDQLEKQGAPFWNEAETFRICLIQANGTAETRLCSRRMGARLLKKSPVLIPLPASSNPRVIVMDQPAPLAGVVPVQEGQLAHFFAEMQDGESYEFRSRPKKPNLVDLSDTAQAGVLRVSGFGTRPLQKNVILNPDQYSRLTVLLGFEPTIGDTRKFWAARLQEERPWMYFPGDGGGVFRQRLELSQVPKETARIHLEKRTLPGTYSDGVWLKGRRQLTSKIRSSEYKVAVDSDDKSLFDWKFKASKKGEINKSYLSVIEGGKTYRSYFEVYRAYGSEFSARMSAIAGGRPLLVTEVAFNHWFENLLGWDQYWLTKQRWGVALKTFRSLNQLPVGAGQMANLAVTTADLKYRLTPGLWTRDETVGTMLSYQEVTFGEIRGPMMGFGAFWARSMPRSLNELFNYLPLMNYPKWVDVEFIYYGQSLKDQVKLSGTVSLNFHGQVLWRENFFGEAGFGFKRYAITDYDLEQQALLNTVYGTMGIGFKF